MTARDTTRDSTARPRHSASYTARSPGRGIAAIGIQIADALHALHRVGVSHRDLKLDNIILAIGAIGVWPS